MRRNEERKPKDCPKGKEKKKVLVKRDKDEEQKEQKEEKKKKTKKKKKQFRSCRTTVAGEGPGEEVEP